MPGPLITRRLPPGLAYLRADQMFYLAHILVCQ
jgi:hypothetical protein